MTLINISSLGVTRGHMLFSDLNLTISKGDRIGLVAANGRGKSSLMACLASELDPTEGQITRARGMRVGTVKQNLPQRALSFSFYDWVLGALAKEQADYESWRVDIVLEDLKVPLDLVQKPLNELSGGWQRTAMLAAVWVQEPDILLLDEPTNHLDLGRISLLQAWLAKLPKDVPLIITSHDRAFLDATTEQTLFLRPQGSRLFQQPFGQARDALAAEDAADERRFANEMSKARQLRRQAAKLKNIGINSGSDLLLTKTKQLSARASQIEGSAAAAHKENNAGAIKLANRGTHAKALITLDDISVQTPSGRLLCKTGQKWICKGDRVILLGANGAGKTQLVKMLQSAFEGRDSAVKCASSVIAAYSDQSLSQINMDQSAMESTTQHFEISDQRARGLLAAAGLSVAQQNRKITTLSGGQKARLALLLLRLKTPNFYLLDEPTNHLDIDGQEALEEELIGHQLSCLIVTHDRNFLRNIGTRFWWIERGKLQEYDSPEPFLRAEMADG
ncbi:MAG: ABC-F family ATP-binding cassette domain-containing protein [Marinovum sp.]|jgi:ATPase subunit of ABC transporter with duplicated ATPase domains|nr:ABC-F family ATP-binding cassette domain-containing protein [Marinovum sp.]